MASAMELPLERKVSKDIPEDSRSIQPLILTWTKAYVQRLLKKIVQHGAEKVHP